MGSRSLRQRFRLYGAGDEKLRGEHGVGCLHHAGPESREQRDGGRLREDLQAGLCSCKPPGERQDGSGAIAGMVRGLQRVGTAQRLENAVPEGV